MSFLGLNAMMPDYKIDIKRCKDDINRSIICTSMNCAPLASKTIRQNKILFPIVTFCAIAQGYLLYSRFMTYRLAQRGKIDWRRV